MHDIVIDLGTANTLVYVGGQGIVVDEPSVVTIDTDSNRVPAVGAEAERMIGRTPATISAVRPHGGRPARPSGAWERELPEHQRYGRRAFLATLCLAGPRISELIDSPRGRLDLHAGQLVLGKKTEAGIDRTLELSAFLLDELRAPIWRPFLTGCVTPMEPAFRSSRPGRLDA